MHLLKFYQDIQKNDHHCGKHLPIKILFFSELLIAVGYHFHSLGMKSSEIGKVGQM